MKIGFIGAGRIGTSFGKYFSDGGMNVSGYFSRTPSSAKESADFVSGAVAFDSTAKLAAASDIIFITTDDDNILPAWRELSTLGRELCGKIICHVSGCATSAIFENIEATGALPASLHMMVAVHNKFEGHKVLKNAVFTVTGNIKATEALAKLVEILGNRVTVIPDSCKPLYHAAAVMSSNFICALIDLSAEMLADCGFDRKDAEDRLMPLVLSAAHAAAENGIAGGLSGPIARGDLETVKAHLSVLGGEKKELYKILSKRLVNISEQKNPNFDYSLIKKELDD